MKFKELLIAVATAALCASAAVSCSKDNASTPSGDPTISLDKTTLSFEAKGDPQTVKLTTNREWAVQKDSSLNWITVTPEKGVSGEAIVTVAVNPNNDDERSASLIFTTGSASVKLSVKQAGSAPTNYSAVKDIRALATTSGAKIADSTYVLCVVTSNYSELSNLTSGKTCYVQDANNKGADTGMQIYFSASHSFPFGSVIKVDLSGQSVKLFNGTVEIDGCPLDKAKLISSEGTIAPTEISEADFMSGKYEGQYITIKEPVQVVSADLSKNWASADAHQSIGMEFADGSTFVVFSAKYATALQSKTVPQGSGKIIGTAGIYNGTIQLYFTALTDADALTGERFQTETKALSVDEAIAKASGMATVKGRVIATSTSGFVINDGTQNNMYVAKVNSGTKVDDLVTVTGTLSKYGTAIRFNSDISFGPCTDAIAQTPSQTVTEVTPEQIQNATFDSKGSASRISFSGVLSTDGTYYNLAIPGVAKPKGSIYTSEDLSAYIGQSIKVTGYYAGHTSNYFMIVSEKIESDTSDYFSVSPATVSVAAAGGSAAVSVSAAGSVAWSATVSDAAVTLDKASGTGSATVNLTVAENTAYTAREFTVTFTTTADVATKEYKVAVKQASAADPSQSVLYLTNAEIKAAIIDACNEAKKNAYLTYSINSASGTWGAYTYCTASTTYLQINNKNGYMVKSPVFASSIEKVELAINKTTAVGRTVCLVPTTVELPTSATYTDEAVYSKAYGSASPAGKVDETVSIEFSTDAKDFCVVAKDGALYIDAITVYLKK